MSEVEKIFSCTRCGFCCQGETTVSLDKDDQERMCDTLGKSFEEVAHEFLRIRKGVVQMKVVDGHCIFFENGCKVHTGRPWRCGEWPLHPSILDDKNNFLTISESCPGINVDIGYEEFCNILRRILAENDRVKC